ncbi:hypothetical protein [Bradyrhizobium sp. 179]|uniref:hypothetical protein n=1 Tax=Bradyrhizobium sp. 179 TaxID=2782648 RepID=UPI001FFB6F5D|nr:hypothetical protein [Bradyrhizobium sp. 179]
MARTKKATEAPIDRLEAMLVRLQLSGIRDQLDNLLEEAARANLSARETLILLRERDIARKDHHVYEDEPYKFTLLEASNVCSSPNPHSRAGKSGAGSTSPRSRPGVYCTSVDVC